MFRIYDKVERKNLVGSYASEDEALRLGLGWPDSDLDQNEFQIYDEDAVNQARSEGQELGNQAQQLAQNPRLNWEDMTLGEKASTVAFPISGALAQRGAENYEIEGAMNADQGLMTLGSLIFPASKALTAGKGAIASYGAPILGEMGLGALYGAGIDLADKGEVTPQGVTLGGIMGGVPRVIGGALGKIGQGARKVFGMFAGEASGAGIDALEAWSDPVMRQQIQATAGRSSEIAKRMVDAVNSPMPENQAVKSILPAMQDVDISGAIQALESSKIQSKGQPLLDWQIQANKAIDGYIDQLRGRKKGFPKTKYSAEAVYALRQGLDVDVNFDQVAGGKSAEVVVNNALKNARTQLKTGLETSAINSGRPEYVDIMKGWSEKLQAKDRLSDYIGGRNADQYTRAQQKLGTMFGKNKEEQREAFQTIGDLFGGDYIEEARRLNYAERLGIDPRNGLPSWGRVTPTGAKNYGATIGAGLGAASALATGNPASAIPIIIGGLTAGSPRASAGVLSTTKRLGDYMRGADQLGLGNVGRRMFGNYLQNNERQEW